MMAVRASVRAWVRAQAAARAQAEYAREQRRISGQVGHVDPDWEHNRTGVPVLRLQAEIAPRECG
jgi:hypothetical protein|eukprot:COSAG01_NODE_8872_length_2630_cov_11.617147_3_plen_65_part_00